MTQARKYVFDTEFGADGAILRQGPSRMTPEALEEERAAAYARGANDATAAAERQSAAALEAIARAAQVALTSLDAETQAMRREAAALALAAARKIAGKALDAFGDDRALAAVDAAMEGLRRQPRLLIKLPAEIAEALKPRIAALADSQGYAGAVLVRAEQGLHAGAVSIDWGDGVIALDPEETAKRIDALVEAALAGGHKEQS